VWIDAQPPRLTGSEAGSIQQHPVKVMTSFKTVDDEIPEAVPPPPGMCQFKTGVASAPAPCVAAPPAETLVAEELNVAVVQNPPEVRPVAAASKPEVRNLTLDELYAQCEQLAESLSNPEGAEINLPVSATSSEDGEPEENESEVDITSEQVSVSCDSWRGVRHLTIHEEEESGTGSTTPQHHPNEYYSPEYIEVEEPEEPVPTQDSCLQVT